MAGQARHDNENVEESNLPNNFHLAVVQVLALIGGLAIQLAALQIKPQVCMTPDRMDGIQPALLNPYVIRSCRFLQDVSSISIYLLHTRVRLYAGVRAPAAGGHTSLIRE